MGYGSAIMVAVVMLASITLLPAMLGVVKHRVNSARVPFVKQKPAYNPDVRLGTLGRPGGRQAGALRRRGGRDPRSARDPGVLDAPRFRRRGQRRADSTTRKAYDLMADGYGPGTNGPLQVVLDTEGATIPECDRRQGRDRPGRARRAWRRWTTPVTNEAGDLAIITVTPTTAPQDARTDELLEHLREDTIPAARGRHRRRGVGHRLDRPDRGRLVAAAAADAAGSSEP